MHQIQMVSALAAQYRRTFPELVEQMMPAGAVDAGQPKDEPPGAGQRRRVREQHLRLADDPAVGRGAGSRHGFVNHRPVPLRIN